MTERFDPLDRPDPADPRDVAEEAAAHGRFPDEAGRLRDDSTPVNESVPPAAGGRQADANLDPGVDPEHLGSGSQGARPERR